MAASSSERGMATPPSRADLDAEIDRIAAMNVNGLRALWRARHGGEPPKTLTPDLLARAIVRALREDRLGGLDPRTKKALAAMARGSAAPPRRLKAGSVLVREHAGMVHEVVVASDGFLWRGETFSSLSTIALRITGTSWNGRRFFGLGDIPDVDPNKILGPTKESPASPSSAGATIGMRRGGIAVASAARSTTPVDGDTRMEPRS